MAGTLPKAESKTRPDIFGDLEAKPLVDTLVETLPHVKAKKVFDTLGDVEPKALVATLANTLGHTMGNVQG